MPRYHSTANRSNKPLPTTTEDGHRIFESLDATEDMAVEFKKFFDRQGQGYDLSYRRDRLSRTPAFYARRDDSFLLQISNNAMSVKIHEFLASSFVWANRSAKRIQPKKRNVGEVLYALEMQLLQVEQKRPRN